MQESSQHEVVGDTSSSKTTDAATSRSVGERGGCDGVAERRRCRVARAKRSIEDYSQACVG